MSYAHDYYLKHKEEFDARQRRYRAAKIKTKKVRVAIIQPLNSSLAEAEAPSREFRGPPDRDAVQPQVVRNEDYEREGVDDGWEDDDA